MHFSSNKNYQIGVRSCQLLVLQFRKNLLRFVKVRKRNLWRLTTGILYRLCSYKCQSELNFLWQVARLKTFCMPAYLVTCLLGKHSILIFLSNVHRDLNVKNKKQCDPPLSFVFLFDDQWNCKPYAQASCTPQFSTFSIKSE